MRTLNKLDNIFLAIWVFLSVSAVSVFGTNEFGEVAQDKMSVFTIIMIWFFAVFLPIGCILGGMLLWDKQTKKQTEQDQDSIKTQFMMLLYVLGAFFVFLIVAKISGITDFYKATLYTALGIPL